MSTLTTRRGFLRQSALAGSALFLGPFCVSAARKLSPNEKLNIGVIGVARQGHYNLTNVADQNIVALCDVDDNLLRSASQQFPSAKTYNDFRRLLDQGDIDAVVVATPDHTHAVAAVAALESGRHTYCEKPLTRTLSECRAVMKAARKSKLATQIGTQIHAGANYRRVVELVQAGVIGEVRDVHVWVTATYGAKTEPAPTTTIPDGLHYDLWLGPVPEKPYSPDYLPGSWRNWWTFGGGALADFGCHFMDLPHWALELRAPVTCEIVDGPKPQALSVPPWLIVRYGYPARGQRPPVTLTWYHGGKQPGPEVLDSALAEKWKSGVLFIGTKGQLLADYGRRQLLPEKEFAAFTPPAPTIPDSIGHHAEWVRACKTGEPTTCNFGYSGALTEAVLLGNVAFRAGCKIEWDSEKLKAKGCKQAEEFIEHQYRKGWRV